MPVDQKTFGSKTPRTLDGRRYPEHLRAYEALDEQLVPVVAQWQPATFDVLSAHVTDPRARAVLPRWLASAEWRGLVERQAPARRRPRTYVVGPRARALHAA
jgi:hypothetical protein